MQNQSKQHTLWLLAAVSAPVAHFSGCGWFSALLAAAAALPLILVPKHWEGMGKGMALGQALWLGAVTGLLLKNSAVYWPSDNDLAVPAVLLALAAVTVEKSAPRIGAVLAFCMALLAIPVAVSGAAHLEPDWLKTTQTSWPAALSLVLLFPALPAAGEGKKGRQCLWIALAGVCLALLVQGTISPQVAAGAADPFYQTARTLGYLEPVAAVGMTLGWYAMTVFLLDSGRRITQSSGINARVAYVLPMGTAAGILLLKWQPGAWLCAVLSAFLWILVPTLRKITNMKKDEKRC